MPRKRGRWQPDQVAMPPAIYYARSIRQPYAEEILFGLKTIEYRSRPTTRINERFYIYAAKGRPTDRQMRGYVKLRWTRAKLDPLPRGLLVGTAIISKCVKGRKHYEWHLTDVQRLPEPIKPDRHPQPAWFRPFA